MTPALYNITTVQNQHGKQETYAARQEAFETESRIVIDVAAKLMKTMTQKMDPDYSQLFRNLLYMFARKRTRIASEASTPNALEFGKERISDPSHAWSLLVDLYANANKLAINQLGTHMRHMTRTLQEFQEKTKKIEECIQERRFSFQVEILDPRKFEQYNQDIPSQEIMALKKNVTAEHPNATDFELIKKMKEKRPDLYKHARMKSYLVTMMKTFPSPQVDLVQKKIASGCSANLKSNLVLVTKRTEIQKKMYATSQWLTWIYHDYQHDPVERMLIAEYCPPIMILHQDSFLINDALDECERIFCKIMQWNHAFPSASLKKQVALLRYIFAEAMPYFRGSAAIGEWLEQAIYKMHGFTCTYHPTYPRESIDLVALINLKYSDYLTKYMELVQCGPQQLQ